MFQSVMRTTAPERRRRRPAVSCIPCRRRKIKCNRESPCSNCVKSKDKRCEYENDVLLQQRSYPPELEVGAAAQETRAPEATPPRAPSYASRSSLSSPKRSWSSTSRLSAPQAESLKRKIRQLEAELTRLAEDKLPSSPAEALPKPNIETTSSQIAGVFHINHESHVRENTSRSVFMHKSRLFGPSHWAQAAVFFRDIFIMIEPRIREEHSNATSSLTRCKDLGRIIKNQRTPQWPTPPTLDLPPKGVADELVDCYLRTIETTYRILHIPTFRTDYDSLWVSDAKPSIAFTVQVKLVLALGAIIYDENFSMRPSAIRWVYEAQTWLSDPDFKPRLNIQSLQSSILLLLAREFINVGGGASWISAGSLLRTALYMGLHRDPNHLPNRTLLAAEMRRRLWNTILELSVQSSMVAGGAPLISSVDFDTEPPGNFDDDQLLVEDAVPRPGDQFTQTSIARLLRETLPQRLAIAKFLNDLGSFNVYEDAIRLDADIRASYKALCRILRDFRSARGSTAPQFSIHFLDFIVHFYIASLHLPFFNRSLQEAQYAFSRKALIESSLKLWCIAYPSSGILVAQPHQDPNPLNQDDLARLVYCGFGFLRVGCMLALMCILLELRTQVQDAEGLGPSPFRTDLFAVLQDAKHQFWRTLEAGETNIKGYLIVCLISAQIEGLIQGIEKDELPTYLLKAGEAAEERCIVLLEKLAAKCCGGDSLPAVDGISLHTTPPFMGDWEFIVPDAFVNTDCAEPISWFLNEENQLYMM